MPERDQAHQHQFSPPTIQAAVRARVQERTGRFDIPDIIGPCINARLPVTSAVKFDDPFRHEAWRDIADAICRLKLR